MPHKLAPGVFHWNRDWAQREEDTLGAPRLISLPRYQMEIEPRYSLFSMPVQESRSMAEQRSRFIPVHTHYGVVNMQVDEPWYACTRETKTRRAKEGETEPLTLVIYLAAVP